MSKLSPILAPEADRAHYVAQITLSALAVLMLGALAWAGWKGAFPGLTRSLSGEPVATSTAPATSKGGMSAALPPNVMAVESLPAPTPAPTSNSAPPPRIGATTVPVTPIPSLATAPLSVDPRMISPPSSSSPLGKPITNPQAKEMVRAAREVRNLGDMRAALESLRAADLQEPQHPEILSEMALTYEAMHLTDKAVGAWRSVLALGEAAAGGYYSLARSKLEGLQDAEKTAAISAGLKPLSLGSCQVMPDKLMAKGKGQRVTVRIPLMAVQGTPIDPTQVDLRVFFFDKLADGSVGPTHADPPSFNWISAPVDWKDSGEELVDVTYYMPELKPEELRNLGKRSYHGFVVKLFYQNQFMGEQAEPRALLDFKPQGAGPAGMNNALFPKN